MRIPTDPRFIDLTGNKFGKLSVIEYQGISKTYKTGHHRHCWLCKCDCGKECVINGNSLRNGNTTSCGCFHDEIRRARLIDLTGRKFGLLTVLELSHKHKTEHFWKCKCDCGNEHVVVGTALRHGLTKSCGCRQGWRNGNWSGKTSYQYKQQCFASDPSKRLQHSVSCWIRTSMKRRGLSKNRSKSFKHLPYTPQQLMDHLESLWEPWMSWDNYGEWHIDHVVPQSKFPYSSLDDPLFVECWALSNLRPLEKIENFRKGNR